MENKHFLRHIKLNTLKRSLLLNGHNDSQEPNREHGVSNDPPDVKISQHLQIDDGFWDALDAVVVEVERLEGGEQTHFWRNFREAILGQICNTEEQELMKYVQL